jgi:hypothetical protein
MYDGMPSDIMVVAGGGAMPTDTTIKCVLEVPASCLPSYRRDGPGPYTFDGGVNMRRFLGAFSVVFSLLALAAVPQAVLGAYAKCEWNECPNCDPSAPDGTACFVECDGYICEYVYCSC